MPNVFYFLFFSLTCCFSQSIQQCKYRFDTYLNFKGSLNNRLQFKDNAIFLLDVKGKKEIAIYANEIPLLAKFMVNTSLTKQINFIKQKGLKNFTKKQIDSISNKLLNNKKINKQDENLPLSGYKIALDPGHTAINLNDAQIEQKFLYFVKDSINHPMDTIKLFESVLTFNTAKLLEKMLLEQGAKVFITRSQNNFNSFNCTYTTWLKNNRIRVLDSLKNHKIIEKVKYTKLKKMSDRDFFWEFFRDFDLNNRAKIINEFNPHASIIIHFNVDEKNEPWKKTTTENFTMAFIGGAFTSDNLDKLENKIHFLRLLLTDQLNQSEKLASLTVNRCAKNLNISIASQFDANYLKDNCLFIGSKGVFSRNLNMCRLINSPLVYGESLYQDCEKECEELMKVDLIYKDIKTNQRLLSVAKSYNEAILQFFKN